MQNIDTLTIIVSVVLIFLALLTPFINPFFRSVRKKGYAQSKDNIIETCERPTTNSETSQKEGYPSISILLTPTDNAEVVSENLSLYLNQDYPSDFQVIVVAPEKDKETEDVLKQHTNERLYFTFIPDSSRYMSKKKLAITLGVKAAKYNWIAMADIFCKPSSENWLKTLADGISEKTDLIVGSTQYDEGTTDFKKFERFLTAQYLLREYAFKTPYRCEDNALMFKKDMFLNNEGFRGNLKYIRGEFDFIVNKYALKGNLTYIDNEEGTLIEPAPTDKMYRDKHLFYMEDRKHLERSTKHRLIFNIDQWALHLNYIALLAGGTFAGITKNWIILGAAVLALLLTLSIRILIFYKRSKLLGVDIPLWKIIFYEIRIIWHNIKFMIMYRRADKYDFISHKL